MIDLFDDASLPVSIPEGMPYRSERCLVSGADWLDIPNGRLLFIPDFFATDVADKFLNYLLQTTSGSWRNLDHDVVDLQSGTAPIFQNIHWQHDEILMFGKRHRLPRLSAWYGDDNATYTYSGIELQPKGWNSGLSHIRKKLSLVSGTSFNSVLLNWYRNGEDHIGWHTDAEPELGADPVIASVNFGATRDFLLRSNDQHWKFTIPLTHGSLLIMAGSMQHYWQHSVPKRKRVHDTRVNLTFRNIRSKC